MSDSKITVALLVMVEIEVLLHGDLLPASRASEVLTVKQALLILFSHCSMESIVPTLATTTPSPIMYPLVLRTVGCASWYKRGTAVLSADFFTHCFFFL